MSVNKKQFLRSLSDVYCRLGVTKHGVGVVAIRNIPKGIDPFKRCDAFGDVIKISAEELMASGAPKEAVAMVRDFCALQDGYYYVPNFGMDAIDKSYYLNHSKKPNLVTHNKGETFIAMRTIKKGEELTADYDQYDEDLHKRGKRS